MGWGCAIGAVSRGRRGDKETRRQGDKETRRQGDTETREQVPDLGHWNFPRRGRVSGGIEIGSDWAGSTSQERKEPCGAELFYGVGSVRGFWLSRARYSCCY